MIKEGREGDSVYLEFITSDGIKRGKLLFDGEKFQVIFGDNSSLDISSTNITTNKNLILNDTAWDDLRVAATATEQVGANAPTYRTFKSVDSTFTGNCIEQEDNSEDITSVLTGAQVGFGSDLSISFWMEGGSFSGTHSILELGSFYIEWRFSDNLRIGGYGGSSVNGAVTEGQRTFVVFTMDNTAGNDWTVNLYLNGTLVDTDTFTNASMPTYTADTPTLFPDGWRGKIDNLAIFSAALSAANVVTYYNSGEGLAVAGDEDDIAYGWTFDEGTGDEVAEVNAELVPFTKTTDINWATGLVASTQSTGVVLKSFSPTVEQEVFFEVQFPHAWDNITAIKPHVHWTTWDDGGAGEDVIWGLEYTWAGLGETFSDSQIIYTNQKTPSGDIEASVHTLSAFPAITPTSNIGLSSMMICRLFRAVEETDDDFSSDVGLLEFDIHYQINGLGSDDEYVK